MGKLREVKIEETHLFIVLVGRTKYTFISKVPDGTEPFSVHAYTEEEVGSRSGDPEQGAEQLLSTV